MIWLSKNQDKFKERVCDPIMMNLNVKKNENAKYIEATIGVRDFTAFVCTNMADTNTLLAELHKQHLEVDVVHSNADNTVLKKQISIQELTHIGAESILSDLIEGPAPIINYVCKIYAIHNTIIGSDNLMANWRTLPQQVTKFFTPENRISINKSRYTNDSSIFVDKIYSKNSSHRQNWKI